MIAWLLILGAVAALLLMPVGVLIRYDTKGPLVKLTAGPIHYRLYPSKGRRLQVRAKSRRGKKNGPARISKQAPEDKQGGAAAQVRPFVKTIFECLHEFRRSLVVRELELRVTLGGEDPCQLALAYAGAWSALGAALPVLEQAFRIRRRKIDVASDFTSETTSVYFCTKIAMPAGSMLRLALIYGLRFLKTYRSLKTGKGGAQV